MEGGGGERSVFRAKRERERVSAKPIERHQEVAEERVRGAEPLGGVAAQRRKRASRRYMLPFARVEHELPLRQRMLPSVPEQNHTLRTTLPTRFHNRVLFVKYGVSRQIIPGIQELRQVSHWNNWRFILALHLLGAGQKLNIAPRLFAVKA